MIIIQTLFALCIICIVYTYGLYPLLLKIIQKHGKTYDAPILPDNQLPGVSIIIAAYNEESVIKERIQNCLNCDYPSDKLEIIIASDGSDDQTANLASTFNQEGVVFFDYHERRGKINVLNTTVPQTKFDLLVFSDANTHFEPQALKKLVRHFQNPTIGGVCGCLKFVAIEGSNSGEMEGLYWKFETFLKTVEGRFGALLGANGAIYAIRKKLFVPCPSDTIVDDFVIAMKVLEQGYQMIYDTTAIAFEESAGNVIQEKKRRIRIGAGDFQALGLLRGMLDLRKGFPALAFWSHKVLRWCVPFFMIGAMGTNLFLLNRPLYQITFALQCLFYAAAFLGQILCWAGKKEKVCHLCYYFCSMNLALLLGFVNFMAKTHSVKWERTVRNTTTK